MRHKNSSIQVISIIIVLSTLLFLIAAKGSDQTGKTAKLESSNSSSERTALVIGNGNYASPVMSFGDAAHIPTNDSKSIRSVLGELGFAVSGSDNLSKEEMLKEIKKYGADLKKDGGIGIFYYSGHGAQYEDINYLLPIETRLTQASDIENQGISLVDILNETTHDGINIIILDSCRDTPKKKSINAKVGLAMISEPPLDTLIVLATEAGKEAIAGTASDLNSMYTAALLRHIKTPIAIELVFRKVRDDVMKQTKKEQIPRLYGELTDPFNLAYDDFEPDGEDLPKAPRIVTMAAPIYHPNAAVLLNSKMTKDGGMPDAEQWDLPHRDHLWVAKDSALQKYRGIAGLLNPSHGAGEYGWSFQGSYQGGTPTGGQIPDSEAELLFEFESPVAVDELEVLSGGWGIRELQAWVGNEITTGDLFSIGTATTSCNPSGGALPETTICSYKLAHTSAGRFLKIKVIKTFQEKGEFWVQRIYPKVNGKRLGP